MAIKSVDDLDRIWSDGHVHDAGESWVRINEMPAKTKAALQAYIAQHTKEAVKRAEMEARIDGMNELATELKRYDWSLEDSLDANDVVCEQIDFSLARLAAPAIHKTDVGGGAKDE